MSEFETLVVAVTDSVALVRLARPEALNTMSLTMREELATCFVELQDDADVRAIVITAEGRAFSAGGDMKEFQERTPEEMHDLMRDKSHRWFEALWRTSKPTIAAVNGVAAGGGINLALACDFIVASENATFGQTFVRVGLLPDLGGLFLLPRDVGLHRAKALCLTGDLLSAAEAHELGLVYEVVADDDLLDEALALASRLAAGSDRAYAAIKSMLNRSFELSMDEMLRYELYAQSFLFTTGAYEHRRDAFLTRSGLDGKPSVDSLEPS
jgi:2-(1,2-epoxy-1,2-dihydrophenyl)acetyl-CoA isomerase